MLLLGMLGGMALGSVCTLIFLDLRKTLTPPAKLFDWRYDPDIGVFPQGEFDD